MGLIEIIQHQMPISHCPCCRRSMRTFSACLFVSPPHQRNTIPSQSLDTFRGLSIVIMIFVNYGGGSYWFFAHSPWNGLTVADLVFPWFLWIMGVSLAISIRSQLRNSMSRSDNLKIILTRVFILIILICKLIFYMINFFSFQN